MELLHPIREVQSALAALSAGDLSHGPDRESLGEFLAQLPERWRAGEARPTHRSAPPSPRPWRTRQDPVEEVGPEVLLGLHPGPDATAKSLMDRLHREYPGRFPEGQLPTVQRRLREWPQVMARSLVRSSRAGVDADGEPIVGGARGEV